MLKSLILLSVVVSMAVVQAVPWTHLKITHREYNDLPMTVRDAESAGWTKRSGCEDENALIGERYILGDDESVVLIFNLAGEISGIASHIPKENAVGTNPYQVFPVENQAKFFDLMGDVFVSSAYFTDPELICEPGSSSTFNRLIIKSKTNMFEVNTRESEGVAGFTKGQCFPSMGRHYWAAYQSELNAQTKPSDFMPGFLQYNDGFLTGFGWAQVGDSKWLATSPRYEHPEVPVLGAFFSEVPDFFNNPDLAGLNTQHIYFTSDPATNNC